MTPSTDETLDAAIEVTLRDCLAVTREDSVVIVVDPTTRELGETARERVLARGAEVVLVEMTERERHGAEPPASVAAALGACTVFLAPTAKSLSHTAARLQATRRGARGATLPEVTAELLARTMTGDFAAMVRRSREVGEILDAGSRAHISCPRGTDLSLELSGRPGYADDGVLVAPGAFGNLPAGEGYIAPLSASGTLVASSVAGLGLSDPPARLTVTDGRLVDARAGVGPALLTQLQAHGDAGVNVAELGVGTNEAATLTGHVLEDEKILGTVHVAFGASAALGGTVSVPIHLDVVVLEATLDVDERRVLEAGRYVLDAA